MSISSKFLEYWTMKYKLIEWFCVPISWYIWIGAKNTLIFFIYHQDFQTKLNKSILGSIKFYPLRANLFIHLSFFQCPKVFGDIIYTKFIQKHNITLRSSTFFYFQHTPEATIPCANTLRKSSEIQKENLPCTLSSSLPPSSSPPPLSLYFVV